MAMWSGRICRGFSARLISRRPTRQARAGSVPLLPQQALFFLNAPLAVEQARALVLRPEIAGATDDAQRVRRLYRTLFDRLPTADETAVGLAFLKRSGGGSVVSPTVWQYGFGGYDEASKRVHGLHSVDIHE